jgi:hypothetical protein
LRKVAKAKSFKVEHRKGPKAKKRPSTNKIRKVLKRVINKELKKLKITKTKMIEKISVIFILIKEEDKKRNLLNKVACLSTLI